MRGLLGLVIVVGDTDQLGRYALFLWSGVWLSQPLLEGFAHAGVHRLPEVARGAPGSNPPPKVSELGSFVKRSHPYATRPMSD